MCRSDAIFSSIKWGHRESANDVVNNKPHQLLSTAANAVNIPNKCLSLCAVLSFFLASTVYSMTLSRSFTLSETTI